MRLLVILGAALAGVLLFLLATASGNTTAVCRSTIRCCSA